MAGYVVKIMIENSHPPIWRRIELPEKISFYDLHRIIQIAFGWEDNHLHGFVSSDKELIIDDESWNYQEDETLIDDYIGRYPYIRYTYDFGDCWEHKIVLEKIDPDYNERCAKIIKIKGGNPPEDCGGIWAVNNGEEYAIPATVDEYYLKTILNGYKFPVRVPGDGDQQKSEFEISEGYNDWEDFWKDDDFSEDDDELDEDLFGITLEDELEEYFELPAENQGGLSYVEGDFTLAELAFDTGETLDSIGGSLLSLETIEKGLPSDDFERWEIISEECSRAWVDNPLYLTYAFSVDELKQLRELSEHKYIDNFSKSVLVKAQSLGLIGVDLFEDEEEGKIFVSLSIPRQLEEMFASIDDKTLKRESKVASKQIENIENLLRIYLALPSSELTSLYEYSFGHHIDEIELVKISALCAKPIDVLSYKDPKDGRMKFYIYGTPVGIGSIISITCKDSINEKLKDVPYRKFKESEIRIISKSLTDLCPGWGIIISNMLEITKDKELTSETVTRMYAGVVNGTTDVCELYEFYSETVGGPEDVCDSEKIWENIMWAFLETRTPELKGYNYIELIDKGILTYEDIHLCNSYIPVKNNKIKSDTRLCDLEPKIQNRLGAAMFMNDNKKALKEVSEIKDEIGTKSAEAVIAFATVYAQCDKYEEALKILKEFKNNTAVNEEEKNGIDIAISMVHMQHNILKGFDKGNQIEDFYETPKQEPYRREGKKIGRNEPCPCGSGKKYKKCCGRNAT